MSSRAELPCKNGFHKEDVARCQELGSIKGLGKWGLAKGLAEAGWSALGFQAGHKRCEEYRRVFGGELRCGERVRGAKGSFRSKGLELGAARPVTGIKDSRSAQAGRRAVECRGMYRVYRRERSVQSSETL